MKAYRIAFLFLFIAQRPAKFPPIRFAVASQNTPALKFHAITDILSLPDPEWLIANLLIKGSFAVLFGPPGVGKSFLALSWAFAVAAATPWHGRNVNGGPVVYIAAEGFGGLKQRVSALLDHEDYGADTPCKFRDSPIDLVNDGQRAAFISDIRKSVGQPALIIIDTLARCFVGRDENSATDMGLFIHGAEAVKRATGATVLVVHHTGKNERSGARGSSALMGAADTMISCGGELGILELKCEKQKDAEPFKKFTLALRTIKLENGRSSCVLVPFEDMMAGMAPASDATTKKILAVLEKFEPEGATAGEWQRACKDDGVTRETFFRRREKLEKAGLVEKVGEGQGARYRPAKSEPVSVSG